MPARLIVRVLVALALPTLAATTIALAIAPTRAPVDVRGAPRPLATSPAPTTPGVPATVSASAPTPPGGVIPGVPYGPEPFELLDLHLPDRTRHPGPIPVIVYLHSGGWIGGARSNVADAALAQVARGYAVVSVDYQLAVAGGAGTFPNAVYDVKRAIRFLKANARTWGLDASRVIVMGASAGGYLAALTGASAGSLEPALTGPLATVDSSVIAIVDVVGITDLATFATTPHPWAVPLTDAFLGCPKAGGASGCTPEQLREASVAPYVGPGSPPIFMAYGANDTLVVPASQGEPLARTWAAAHPGDTHAVVYDLVPAAGHNLSVAQIEMPALDGFLDRAAGGGALTTERVLLYGDSLAWESRDAFTSALGRAGITDVITRTFGGTAICDWVPQMRVDQAALHPDAVVVEFSGNALTPCMKDADGQALTGIAYSRKYMTDAQTVMDVFASDGSLVYFAGAPISRRAEAAHDATVATLDAMYADVAASSPLGRFVDAGAAVTAHGGWTATLPCLGGEPCIGGRDASGTPVNVVRAPDGAHFCPAGHPAVGGVTGACPVWSSGAWRFGTAMADPIPLDLAAAPFGAGNS